MKKYDFNENYKSLKTANKINKQGNLLWIRNLSEYKYIAILIIIVALFIILIILILRLLRDTKLVNLKNSANNQISDIDNIETAHLESMLHNAIVIDNYKEAVRYQYLILIRTLSQYSLIAWKKDKTNGQYVKEMLGKNGFEHFIQLTQRFEYIWYGEASVKKSDYYNLLPLFNQINYIISGRE